MPAVGAVGRASPLRKWSGEVSAFKQILQGNQTLPLTTGRRQDARDASSASPSRVSADLVLRCRRAA